MRDIGGERSQAQGPKKNARSSEGVNNGDMKERLHCPPISKESYHCSHLFGEWGKRKAMIGRFPPVGGKSRGRRGGPRREMEKSDPPELKGL